MLELLLGPIGIALLAVVLAMLISLLVVQTRRRAKDAEIIPPPEVGDSVDYTSLTYEEPTTWSDRFRQASPAAKALLVLLPLVLLASIGIIYFAFLYQPGATATSETPEEVAPPPEISDASALVAGANRILVQADTTLPGGTTVSAIMRENNEDFTWFNTTNATAQVRNNAIRMSLSRQDEASTPDEDAEYTIVLSATLSDGETINFDPIELEIPAPNQASFFQQAAIAATEEEPTEEPAPEPTATPTEEPAPEPTEAPTEVPVERTATVFNGGNVRAAPNIGGQVLDQINANESVELLEQTADGTWYRITNERGVEGWVSVTLLSIDASIAEEVPIEGQAAEEPEESDDQDAPETLPTEPTGLTAVVFNGGNVRSAPNISGEVRDQIDANETVQLLERTADGTWYRIRNEREVEGWVSVTLLTIDASVVEQVPIAE
ncbi:MAG: hypothetical protein GFH27_549289n291 [Chloroflexi bacterium AL-W]|nr:hypothetical protein [Chloroflexi bacterium AL-N1]NOK67023.1 hypothetical protein [Chloroflexi bacterium AL-N10]NOK74685.1 hypothetical protein [Chloroflexi bacterium AL-N5]NOK81625.1 hypothetical protein [Chloroflexi bacterium AL-W]NOK89095.1 hypothetical protein [Chloroflexi bacterium AL-N15]